MNAAAPLHPTDQALRSRGQGKLDGGSASAIDTHLEQCPECRERASAISADGFRAERSGLGLGASLFGQSQAADHARDTAPPLADSLPPGLANHRDYQVRRELGRGGMGVVYLAHNLLMGRDEVLKVMGRQIMERPGVLDRFLREIRAVAKLRHPNIVSAHTAFRLEGNLIFAMEYVEGLDLSRMVKSKGPLPVAHACLFAHQAALGLQNAHDEGLVHRDIKPANLMLSRKGEKATVKVLDFGLAKATREQQVDGQLTSEGQALGTPDFIAPEQILDAPSADIRADIYSLGGTLFYLLTGRPPFKAGSLYDIYQAHISRDADPLNLVRPEVPAELAALVSKMMAKDPARRFQTPDEAARALAPFFKKASAASKRPDAEISRTEPEPAPRAEPIAMPASPVAVAPEGTVRDRKAVKDAASETSPIEFKEAERPKSPSPATKPKTRTKPEPEPAPDPAPPEAPPRKRYRVALGAAGFLGLVALGVIITIRIDQGGVNVDVKRSDAVAEVSPVAATVPVSSNPGPDGKASAVPPLSGRLRPVPSAPGPDRKATVGSGRWSIEGGELVQSSDGDGALIFGDPEWSEYDLTLEVMKVTGPGHGIQILFHRQGQGNFAWFGLGVFENKGSELYHQVNGKGTRGGATNPDNYKWEGIKKGEWYPVKIKVRKDAVDCFLDESRLFRESIPPLSRGRIGLRTGSTQARFRQIKVTSPDGRVLWEGLPDPESIAPLSIRMTDGTESTGWVGNLSAWRWDSSSGELTNHQGEFQGGIASGRTYKDFELRCRIRHDPWTNSGIMFRVGPEGLPQCEIHEDWTGNLLFVPTGGPWQTLRAAPGPVVARAIAGKKDGFNEYVVRCVGKHVTIRVNGVTTVDGDFPAIPDEGRLSFEPSSILPMTIRNLQITDLDGATGAAPR